MVNILRPISIFKKRSLIPLAEFLFSFNLNFLLFLILNPAKDTTLVNLIIKSFLLALVVLLISIYIGIYKSLPRSTNPFLIPQAISISFLASTLISIVFYLASNRAVDSLTFFYLYFFTQFFEIIFLRYLLRLLLKANVSLINKKIVAIYGAGEAGQQLAAMLNRAHEFTPVAFIDDNKMIKGLFFEGIPVLHPHDTRIKEKLTALNVGQILLAIPSINIEEKRKVVSYLKYMSYEVRSVPGLSELVNGSAKIADLREIKIEDLLGRDPIPPDEHLLRKCVGNKSILISGGGGSIGSEICRQALALNPIKIIVVDSSELALYNIEQELTKLNHHHSTPVELLFILNSVTAHLDMLNILKSHKVDTIFHAAAYKHVPIVEGNPISGFINNVIGTDSLARAALKANVLNFVLISTDKVVRPTNVMGATKRIAELVIQSIAHKHDGTSFTAVRFGNVLGSSGSVIPLFLQQIRNGGPVTITDPNVTRYFMTISEAVQLVIQSAALSSNGDTFLLDMGKPMKIIELARQMIHLSGLEPIDANGIGDIEVKSVGLRPGEKLYEELLLSGEFQATSHPMIYRADETRLNLEKFNSNFESVKASIKQESFSEDDLAVFLEQWVSGFRAHFNLQNP
jgi:FlaA1/EpsC-like NDP-sugar epimerase